ncbi:9646_t:CDS:2 [Paraglomus occultum]|uniref:9646_t:CDS:1 n=1 Tax=Paraglomus occultum TaxID=144539 RepID=A0A9N8Z7D4_9GLOM|nr:9646_t:CDS:2 [Paraglomus occultum]
MDNFDMNNSEATDLERLLMEHKALGETFALSPSSVASLSGRHGDSLALQSAVGRIIEELKDFLHVISPTGKLMYCSPSSTELVGYSPEELVNRNIADFIHVDDIDTFLRDFNMGIQQKSSFTVHYRFRKKDDKFIILEVNARPLFSEGPTGTSTCKCFFAIGRSYPSKTTAMLDSFLELKIENENLKRQLRELMGPPEVPADLQNEGVSSDTKSVLDIINSASGNPLEMLTGLQEGERAIGISRGSASPNLINETLMDLDAASGLITANREENLLSSMDGRLAGAILGSSDQQSVSPSRSRRKKKPKVEEEEYVCTDCGTVESPEWRKGPQGPKTLCNACGLRWAKKTKRQASTNTTSGSLGSDV